MLKNTSTKQRGFTLVELLIVIVVIAILAAISIVAYNGIQNRGRTTSAQSAAANVVKKAELYNTEESGYPTSGATLSGAGANESYALTGVTFGTPAGTADPETIQYQICGTGSSATAPTTVAGITTTTGVVAEYWDYTSNSTATSSAGIVSGTVGSNNVGCVDSNS